MDEIPETSIYDLPLANQTMYPYALDLNFANLTKSEEEAFDIQSWINSNKELVYGIVGVIAFLALVKK